METAILSPEEEPDAGDDERCGEKGKEGEDTFVVYGCRGDGGAARRVLRLWSCITSSKDRAGGDWRE